MDDAVKDGGQGTATPAAEAVETSQENSPETTEDVTETPAAPAAPEKKYTDDDMKKARESFQHESRKDRDARIAAETELKIRKEMEEATKAVTPTAKPEEDAEPVEPDEDAFETLDELKAARRKYTKDLADHAAKKAIENFKLEQAQIAEQGKVKTEAEKRQEEYNKSLQVAQSEISDFQERVLRRPDEGGPNFTPAMVDAFLNLENGHRIANVLEQDRAELARIAALPPIRQVAELGAIAHKLKSSTPAAPTESTTQKTKAPSPPSTLSGGGATSKKAIKDMTSAERCAHFQAEIDAGR